MPVYSFKCPRCGNTEEYHRPVSQCNRKATCPECGVRMNKDIAADHRHSSGPAKEWATGNRSQAMAILPKDAEVTQEALRGLPGCKSVEVDKNTGEIVTYSQKQKNACIKFFGLVDQQAYY